MIDALWADEVTLSVELALGLESGEPYLTLDDATDGRLDYGVLASPGAPFDDVTCDVRRLEWQSGATRTDGVLTRWESGSAVLVLDNNDGKYDVAAPGNRYVPMVRLRIRAQRVGDATIVPMWMGYTDSWEMQWQDNDAVVVVTATDGVKLLSSYNGPEQDPPIGAGDTSAARVSRLLDEAEWTGLRRITAGGKTLGATSVAQDIWTELLVVQDAELGALYVAPDGAVVFEPRDLWFDAHTSADVVAVFGPDDLRYEDASTPNDDVLLRNIIDASRVGGTEVHKRDNASVARYKPHRYGRNDLPFASDTDVADWANIVLQTSCNPAPRIDTLVVLPQTQPDELWPVVLGTEYADKWRVTVAPPGTRTNLTRPVQVRGWAHEVDRDTWRVTYALSATDLFQLFVLDDPDPDATLDVMRLA